MTTYGVTSTGFVKKDLEAVVNEIGEDQQDLISPTLNLLNSGVIGKNNGIFADQIRQMWDLAEAVYASRYPDSASGASLDSVCSITGYRREEPERSSVTLDRLYLDNGVTIPIDSVVSVGPSGARFITTAAVTNSSGYKGTYSTTAESEEYGEINGYSGTIDTIQTSISGWSAAAALTCATAETYSLDGTSLTLQVDQGATQTVTFAAGNPWSASDVATQIEADTTGVDSYAVGTYVRVASDTEGTGSAIKITGGTANAVLVFVTDLIKGFNSEDAVPGNLEELDPSVRINRLNTVRAAGSSTFEALKAAVTLVDDVDQVILYENDKHYFSSDGLPPNSFEVVALGGTDVDVAQAIFDTKPLGIRSWGSTVVAIDDSQGFSHDIGLTRPTEIILHIKLTLTIDSTYPVDGDALVKAALVAYAATLTIGVDAIILQFKAIPLTITGVVDVPTFYMDIVPDPTGTANISIGVREIVSLSTGKIVIV